MMKNLKEKVIGASGSVSGVASVMGSWQICHSVCLGIIALLGILGIAVVGMPLAFLTKLALPFWIIAFVLLLVTIVLYVKKKCISNRIILVNSGLITAGVPFQFLQPFSAFFWIIGGLLFITGTSLFIKDKIKKRRCKYEK